MKKILPALLLLILGLILGAAATWLYTRTTATALTAATTAPTAAAPAAPEKPNPLQLNAAKRAAAGITLAKSAPATIAPQVEAYARVLDTTTLIAQAADIQAARLSLDATQKDLDRTQKLHDTGGNASDAQLETAQAALARDTAALAAANAKLLASWGRDLAQNANNVLAQIMAGATLLRIDLLPGDAPAPAVKQARLVKVGGASSSPPREQDAPAALTADIIAPAPVADPQILGSSYIAIVRDTTNTLPVGAQLRATLPAAGAPVVAPAIPRAAIIYYQGSAWIYVLGEEDTFERKLVTPGRLLPDDRVAIASGLDDPDDQIAVTGAQQLLSAELQSGQSGEED